MQGLKVAVIGMGVLIVVATLTLAVLLVRKVGAPSAMATALVLDEPAGTRIVASAVAPDRVLLQLQGGGPDRVVLIDSASGRVLARAGMAH